MLIGSSERDSTGTLKAKLVDLADNGLQICVANQSFYEYWSVATRPVGSNGLGLEPARAAELISKVREGFFVLEDPSDLFERWFEFCQRFDIRGRPSHDARLIALAEAHQITHFFTLDAGFYRRFTHMTIVTP